MPHKISFNVLHATSTDDGHKVKELEVHNPLVKGWQSVRFCLYPQEIILRLHQKTRIRKLQLLAHQFLIPTKIEFFVGSLPPSHVIAVQGTRYKRLGYVSMSDNEKTGFKARELKSVHVDAIGQYLRLVIHKNYINKYNLYNQVGIVAINVIGDEVDDDGNLQQEESERVQNLINKYLPNGPKFSGDEESSKIDPAVLGAVNNPDFISPMDDLAFDMYQDPEVAQIIRKLDLRKNEAVLQEQYDVAKRLKQAVADLQKVGERLGRYEVEKRRAIETEDYDLAKIKKIQMDEYRLQIYKQLELHDLLEISKSESLTKKVSPRDSIEEPPPTVKPVSDLRRSSYEAADDRPLPALKNSPRENVSVKDSPRHQEVESRIDEAPYEGSVGDAADPELPPGMTQKQFRDAAGAIEVFSEAIVFKAFTKAWAARKEAMMEVSDFIESVPTSSPNQMKRTLQATLFMISKGLKDKVLGVFTAAIDLTRFLLNEWLTRHNMSRADIQTAIEKVLPDLLARIGDTNARLRAVDIDFIIEMALMNEVQPLHVVPTQCVVPFKLNTQSKMAATRVEIVTQLLQELGIEKNSGLSMDGVMTFAKRALEHTAGEVREAGIRLIFEVYRMKGSEVKRYLPSEENPQTLKNPLYSKIFDGFDTIDGKPTRAERKVLAKKEKQAEKQAKQAEIDTLQKELADLRAAAVAAGKLPKEDADSGNLKQSLRDSAPSPTKGSRKLATRASSIADNSELGDETDIQCVFCGEKDESLRADGMDVHYWRYCPMLKKCQLCKQVVEISGYSEHLYTECESRGDYAKCPRCSEAHKKTEVDKFVSEKRCKPAPNGMARCPLCNEVIQSGDESWKDHLMSPNGCKDNPRRDKQNAKKKGKVPSKSKQPTLGKQPPKRESKLTRPAAGKAK